MAYKAKPRDRATFLDANSIPEPNSGCLLWLGTVADCNGQLRPLMWFQGSRDYAYRHAWRETYGPIPPNIHVLHRCDVPLCINPEHLFLGDQVKNMLDKHSKGRSANKWQAAKTHCPAGHPYDAHNTQIIRSKGRAERRCKICSRANFLKSKARALEAMR